MGSINDVITALRQAPTNVDRGTLFEQLMVRYFQFDPALAQQYAEVSRWIDWPGRDGSPIPASTWWPGSEIPANTPRSSASSTSQNTRWPRATSTLSSQPRARSPS